MVSFVRLMISEVTLSPETVASDLRPVLLRLARELRKETEQLGVTARQTTLLWLVKRSPGLSLAELAALQPGTVLPLRVSAGDPVFLRAGDRRIGRAELVEVEGQVAARVLELLS